MVNSTPDKTFIVRPFDGTDEQYQIMNTIFNARYPEYAHPISVMKHNDESRSQKLPFQRDLIEQDGKVVAFGSYMQSEWGYHPQKFGWRLIENTDVDVYPLLKMYQAHVLEQLKDKDLIGLTTNARENESGRLNFLKAQGYRFEMRYRQSQADMNAFDVTHYAEKLQQVKDSGIEIINAKQLSEEKSDEWRSILHELEWLLTVDVPSPNPPQKKSLDDYIQSTFETPVYLPEAFFIAREGDEYVGMSNLWKDLMNPEKLVTVMTGVLPSHRRRGIATALKVAGLHYAKQYGAKFIETNNEENNPMFQLNLDLGFTPLPAWIDFEKAL